MTYARRGKRLFTRHGQHHLEPARQQRGLEHPPELELILDFQAKSEQVLRDNLARFRHPDAPAQQASPGR